MKTIFTNAIGNWKSTALGVCTFLSVTCLALSPYMTNPVAAKVIAVILALTAAWAGVLMKDAGKQLAIPPGADAPKVVDSHEVPNQPGSVVIKNG